MTRTPVEFASSYITRVMHSSGSRRVTLGPVIRHACTAALTMAVVALLASAIPAATVIIDANNTTPGDDFTNSTTSNTTPATPGALLGTTGWTYNNVRNNGHVGVNTDFPRSGDGSVWFDGTQGPGGNSSKADIEYFNTDGNGNLASMGTLGDITALAYDWYKSSASAASQQSNLRVYVDADGNLATTNDEGYLVFERAYQTNNSVPTDQWITDNVINANLWEVYFGHGNFDTAGNFQPLSVWGSASGFTPSGGGLHLNANSVIFGLNAGIGSGWDTYIGAVDNITIGFGANDPTTYNFEVASVPEPASWVLATIGLAGWGILALRRRRKKAA